MNYARRRRNLYKAWGNVPGANHQAIVALQAQKQCEPSAMSLLRRPRRSLFYIKVAVGVITEFLRSATVAPVARIDYVGATPGALPQAINFCAYGARCLRAGLSGYGG